MTQNIFVAIVGRPNVGKSSLLNRLLGEKIAIVSNKPQTTRNRITGVLTKDATQYVFIDTPGVHKPKNKLGKFMVRQAGASITDVDVTVMVIECGGELRAIEREMIEGFAERKIPVILALNKTDAFSQKKEMLEKIAEVSALMSFAAVVPISALTGDGIKRLMTEIDCFRVDGPHFFEDDTLTDQPEKVMVAEIIREKILWNMHDEIPHGTAVTIEKMGEREDGSILDIEAIIVCERENHKGMLIGKQGGMLKKIASEARKDCEGFFDIKVNLQCWVKVREGWRDSDIQLKNFGYRQE